MSFKIFNFNDHISNGLKSLGYISPTPIQQKAIQPILDGRDLLGLAQTGTGKTAAFALPILQNLSSGRSGNIKSLIIAPTRELAQQTYAYIQNFSRSLNIRCSVIYGGVSRDAQIRELRKGTDIVVACPGRLLDLANAGALNLSKVEVLVLDEADQMFDQGFLPDIKRIITKLPQRRQNLVFSATMPKDIRTLLEGLLVDPVKVEVDHTKPLTSIKHTFFRVAANNKNTLLRSILKEGHVGSAIVFTRTKHKARNLAQQLSKNGFKATSLQGNLSQQQRHQALNGFKTGTYDILVATDIAARGIDVVGVSHVINFDMPGTSEDYIHRSGRTGRASLTGEAYTFATADDYKMIRSLERTLSGELVYRDSPGMAAENVVSAEKNVKKKMVTNVRENRPKVRGKRSSQRNRAVSFDFGV
jgi:superfamily II DNA/RNA helicase